MVLPRTLLAGWRGHSSRPPCLPRASLVPSPPHFGGKGKDDGNVPHTPHARRLPSDPAKDLAELLRLLRSRTFKRTGSAKQAELPEKAFLEVYLSQLPDNGANLPTVWGMFTLLSICKLVKKFGKESLDREEFSRAMEFYLDEFENVLSQDVGINR